jgi:hypothetical protein
MKLASTLDMSARFGNSQTSVFRMFTIAADGLREDSAIHRAAVTILRSIRKCDSRALDPNVWGFGWSIDGKRVYLLVQTTIHEPCGRPASFMRLVVNVADGKVVERLSESRTGSRFRRLLPPEMLRKAF